MLVCASLYWEGKQKLYPIITQLREKETGSREFLGEMDESGSMPETRLFFISNRRPFSQAGNRGLSGREMKDKYLSTLDVAHQRTD